MRRRIKKRIIKVSLLIILALIASERLYNSKAEFQTTAEDASYYGILDAGFTSREKLNDFEFLYELLEENYPHIVANDTLSNEDFSKDKCIQAVMEDKGI